MALEEILASAGHEKQFEDLYRLGFRIPDSAYAFLLRNPAITRSRIREALGLADWGRNDDEAGALRSRLIDLLEKSGALSANFRNLSVPFENIDILWDRRTSSVMLGADGGGIKIEKNQTLKSIDAAKIVELTNKRYDQNQEIQRELPTSGDPPILIDFEKAHWPIEDQGQTLACVAYAVSACVELHLAIKNNSGNNPEPLSARFLYRKTRNDIFQAGRRLSQMFLEGALMLRDVQSGLQRHGICLEQYCLDNFSIWDKAPNFNDFQKAPGQITPMAEGDALTRQLTMESIDQFDLAARPPGLALKVYDWLKGKNPVAVTIPGWFPDSAKPQQSLWHSEMLQVYGVLPIPAPGTTVGTLGHAVCIVGYTWKVELAHGFHEIYPGYFFKDHPGYFVFRNSVGTARKPSNPPTVHGQPLPAGYGLIPADVMEYFVWEYGIVKPSP